MHKDNKKDYDLSNETCHKALGTFKKLYKYIKLIKLSKI